MTVTSGRTKNDFLLVGVGARARIGRLVSTLEPDSAVRYTVDPDEDSDGRARTLFGEGVHHFNDLNAFLAAASSPRPDGTCALDELAAAIVCSPDDTHASIAEQLLEAGIPVFLEKPMALKVEEADRMLATAERTRTRLYVGHNMRHMQVVTQMKRIIDEGLIGEVQAVWCRHFVGDGGDFYFKDWHAQRDRSSTLLLQKGTHDLDVIHYLAGGYSQIVQGLGALMVYDKTAGREGNPGKLMRDWYSRDNWPPRAQTNMNPIIDVEDISMMQMRLDNGVLASYQQCHFAPDYWRNYTVIGDQGRLENFGDTAGGVIRVWNRRHGFQAEGDLEFAIEGDEGGHGDADLLTMAEFLRFVREGEEPVATAEAARAAVAAAVAGVESLRDGGVPKTVARPPTSERPVTSEQPAAVSTDQRLSEDDGDTTGVRVQHVASSVLVPTFTAAQVRDAEQPYLRAGVPLMMRASAALAHVASTMVAWNGRGAAPNVLVLVGSGNNGGDALYAGAGLARRGARVNLVPVGRRWHEGGMEAALRAGVQVLGADPAKWDPSVIAKADLIIDGILGTGTSGRLDLRGAAAQVVSALLESGRVRAYDLGGSRADADSVAAGNGGSGESDGVTVGGANEEGALLAKVVAVDIPSGLHPDTGQAGPVVLPADVTVTFGGMKEGLARAFSADSLANRGNLVGNIALVDIGISEELGSFVPVSASVVKELFRA